MILSTYPRALGSYALLSGTSMAYPLSATIYALVLKFAAPSIRPRPRTPCRRPPSRRSRTAPYLTSMPQQRSQPHPDLLAAVVELAMSSALVSVDIVPVQTCRPVNSTAVVLGTWILGGGGSTGRRSRTSPGASSRSTATGSWRTGAMCRRSGMYKFTVKALRIFGDSKLASEYDGTETISVRVRYCKL